MLVKAQKRADGVLGVRKARVANLLVSEFPPKPDDHVQLRKSHGNLLIVECSTVADSIIAAFSPLSNKIIQWSLKNERKKRRC
jgi:hypothetical protein